jgi:uncharacterized repeat protein (TIGR01451 family)
MSARIQRTAAATLLVAALATCGWLLAVPNDAVAAVPGAAPGWTIESVAYPTDFTPGDTSGDEQYIVTATNVGAAPTNGGAIALTDTLPAGLTPTAGAKATDSAGNTIGCVASEQVVTCTDPDTTAIATAGTFVVEVPVEVAADAPSSVTNEVAIAGGAATGASASQATTLSATPAAFSGHSFDVAIASADGERDTQAGSHPYSLTTSFAVSTMLDASGNLVPVADTKDIRVELPAGLIGNPFATPRCTRAQLVAFTCPASTRVGTITLYVIGPVSKPFYDTCPVYDVVPPEGTPARFAFNCVAQHAVYLDASVRTGSDYGVTMTAEGIPEPDVLIAESLTLWGVPAEVNGGGATQRSLLTLPSACEGPQSIALSVDSWQEPEAFAGESILTHDASGAPVGFTGCEKLNFQPSLQMRPSKSSADSPTGLSVDLGVLQNTLPTLTSGLAEADLRNAVVKLPAGVSVNPSAAAGLVGCSLEGSEGVNLHSAEAASCPAASKIGAVQVRTPLLEEELSGGVYLAQQGNLAGGGSNPFGSLLAIYLVAEGASGVKIKVAGEVEANGEDGQLTTTFSENPQLPFEELKLEFFGGERAAFSTPACGTYAASAELTPYSSAKPVSVEGNEFTISSGCGGGFAPSMQAGTVDPQAGAFSPFTMTLRRGDGERSFSTVAVMLPRGMAGVISSVAQCGEAQASAGSCPAASQIGHVTVQAGVGGEPVTLPQRGRREDPVYLTGPYDGAPFGLSIVVHPEAGPLDLEEGGPVVVRAKIEINPSTAQVTISANAIPQILQGVPLDVQAINVTIDREGFMFNPTSCEPQVVGATIGSWAGADATVSSRFQAADCASLPFKPVFTAGTSADHTRKDGASLTVKLDMGSGEANVAKVHVELPKKLPSELKTLKLACTEAQFAANPAGCPKESMVGSAVAHTPILPVPLQGPAIFVSHGGAGFPNLDLVLQGDGVSIVLVGDTFIDEKTGITTSTFATVPDVPISQFELTLPQQEYSALGGNGSFCEKPLYMPTSITGQNGAVIEQKTKIAVSGCKPQIQVLGRKVRGASAKIRVRVPSAGRLTVSGKGIATAKLNAGGAKVVTIAVRLSASQRRAAARRRQRVSVKVKLLFKPKHGKALLTHTRLLLR